MSALVNLIVLLVLFLIFLLVMKVEPRTLFSGGFLALSGLALFSLIQKLIDMYPVKDSPDEILSIILHALGRLLQLVIAAGPLILALLPIFMGVILIKKEGAKLKNVASIFFGSIAFVYVVVWPLVGGFKSNTPGMYIYVCVTVIMIYFVMLKTVFTASSIVNQIHRKGSKGYQYILVLGTDLEESRIDLLLRKKVDKALELYRENPGSRLVFTGVRTHDARRRTEKAEICVGLRSSSRAQTSDRRQDQQDKMQGIRCQRDASLQNERLCHRVHVVP